MRIVVTVTNAQDAIRSAKRAGLNAWIMSPRVPSIVIDGWPERIERWLTAHGRLPEHVRVVFE